jgi:hypothetical protein
LWLVSSARYWDIPVPYLIPLEALDRCLSLMLSEPDHEEHAGESGEAKKEIPFHSHWMRRGNQCSYPVIDHCPPASWSVTALLCLAAPPRGLVG